MFKNSGEVLPRPFLRGTLVAVGLGLGALTMAGCAENGGVPYAEDIVGEAETVIMPDVTAENGEPVRCKVFTEDGYHQSWLAMACDFQGTAVFEEELQGR